MLAKQLAATSTLAANACKDGLLGNMYRAKYTSTGTYAGGSTVRIDLMSHWSS
jgi:hypothetical protein